MSVEVQQINDREGNELNNNNDDDDIGINEDENDIEIEHDEEEEEQEDDDADDESNDSASNSKSKHVVIDPDLSPSPSLNSSTSLDMTLTGGHSTRNRHPLTQSYKEWLNNWFSISIPAIGFLGCQLSLALQNGFVTPELEELGISEKIVNYAWLAPPLTGTIVQPLIGITSDMMDVNAEGSFAQKYGRRRPFVALGCVMVVFFLLLFSNARYIGLLFGDDGDEHTSNAAIVAVISFWFLDIAINIVQAPLRALVSDIVPSRHHTTANGIFGFANGLGAIIGYALGYGIAYNPRLGGGLSALFAIAAFTVICTSIIMLYLTRGEKAMNISSTSLSEIIAKNYAEHDTNNMDERALLKEMQQSQQGGLLSGGDLPQSGPSSDPQQHQHQSELEQQQPNGPGPHQRNDSDLDVVLQIQKSKFQHIKEALWNMPRPISRAFMVQFWLYFGLFASYIYLTDWFGKKVTHGDPNSDDPADIDAYRLGVRIASIGLSFGAILAVIGSMLLPVIISKCGYRWTWFFCMLLYAVMLLMTPFCDSVNMGITIVTMLGIGQAAAMVIGWSIVTETLADSDQKGVYTTLFTTSHTIPELTVALIAGEIIYLFDNHVSAVLAVGGVAALFGANSALYIVEPKKWLAKQAWLKRQNRVLRNRQNG